jgi:ABC-type transport system involved in multi-copper enzyme maturation permease subunit
MIWLIAEAILRRNFYDLRFVFLTAVTLLLFIASGALFAQEMNQRWEAYQRQATEAWQSRNLEQVRIVRPPRTLAFIAEGGERNLSHVFQIEPEHSEPVEMDKTRGPFLELLRDIDWVYIVGVFLTLLVLLFSYDLISGQREAGTLSLILAQPVSRAQVLVGTYLGTVLSITVPMLIGMTGGLLLVLTIGAAPLTITDGFRIGTVVMLSVVFLSLFVLVSLFLSSRTAYASTTLVSALIVWVLFVLIIPNCSEPIADLLDPLPDSAEYQRRIRQIDREESSKLRISSQMLAPIIHGPYSDEEKRRQVEELQRKLIEADWAARWEIRRMQNRVRQERERREQEHRQLARRLSRLSPFAFYQYVTESLADTGLIRQQRFRRQIERNTASFTSFTNTMRQRYAHLGRSSGYGEIEDAGYRLRVPHPPRFEHIQIPPQDFPAFVDREPPVVETISDALWDLYALVFFNVVLFVATLYAFLRYDVRPG